MGPGYQWGSENASSSASRAGTRRAPDRRGVPGSGSPSWARWSPPTEGPSWWPTALSVLGWWCAFLVNRLTSSDHGSRSRSCFALSRLLLLCRPDSSPPLSTRLLLCRLPLRPNRPPQRSFRVDNDGIEASSSLCVGGDARSWPAV